MCIFISDAVVKLKLNKSKTACFNFPTLLLRDERTTTESCMELENIPRCMSCPRGSKRSRSIDTRSGVHASRGACD